MIHNHEVPGSIPGLATQNGESLKDSLRFLFYKKREKIMN